MTLGATGAALSVAVLPPAKTLNAVAPEHLAIAVCGAHLSGLPLNHQLRDRGAYLLQATRTAPLYRLFALRGDPPQRPGLVRTARGGMCVEVEVWALPFDTVGTFLAGIPAPLGLGSVELEDGNIVTGFICETYGTANAARYQRIRRLAHVFGGATDATHVTAAIRLISGNWTQAAKPCTVRGLSDAGTRSVPLFLLVPS